MIPLAGFGLIHGTHEWIESYLLQAQSLGTPLPEWLSWLKLGFLVSSYVSLSLFAFQALRLVPRPAPSGLKHGGIVLGIYIFFIVTSASLTYSHGKVPIQDVLDVMARYLLAVPASSLAALGLFYTGQFSNSSNNRALAGWLSGAAIGLGFYALTHLFVHPIAMFPANVINADSFRAALGFPIQVVRTMAAIVITVCLLPRHANDRGVRAKQNYWLHNRHVSTRWKNNRHCAANYCGTLSVRRRMSAPELHGNCTTRLPKRFRPSRWNWQPCKTISCENQK